MRVLSPGAATVLSLLLQDPFAPRYGYELMGETGLKSGSLYPILGRFESNGWIVGSLEPSESGRPPRRVYRVNEDAIEQARAALDHFFDKRNIPEPQRVRWGIST